MKQNVLDSLVEFHLRPDADARLTQTVSAMCEAAINPFEPVSPRAHANPQVLSGKASQARLQAAVSRFDDVVTSSFNPNDLAKLLLEVPRRENAAGVKAVAAKLFRRVLGPDYALVEADGWPMVQQGDGEGVPVFLISRGERAVLSFCVYLALAHDMVQPGMCLGLKGVIEEVDSARRLAMVECLGQFMLATGSSLYIQTENQDVLRTVTTYLVPVARLAAGARAP